MNLVEQSFINIVTFHREDLLKLRETRSASHLNKYKRGTLRKRGVIVPTRDGKRTAYELSPEAEKVLKELV